MTAMDSNYWQIVKETINGDRQVDAQTSASIAILNDRLARVKKLGEAFENVVFSPDVMKMAKQNHAASVC